MPTKVRFLLSRMSSLVGLLFVLSVVLFILQEISPGDPVAATLGPTASPEAVAAERERLGLNAPPLERYFSYLLGLLSGNLGTSFRTRRGVTEDVLSYLPATAELVLFAALAAVLLAVLFAVSSVLQWKGAFLFRGLLFLGSTAPTFLLSIAGLVIFYSQLGWLPGSGRADNRADGPTGLLVLDGLLTGNLALSMDALAHLVLPAAALAVSPALAIGRVFRSSLISTLQAEYVRTARSKGLTEARIVGRHVLRNSLNAALSMTGLQIGFMFSGVLVIEGIFSWPGLGSYLGASIPVSDFPAIAGVTFILGAIYLTANTVVDFLQSVADPRIVN